MYFTIPPLTYRIKKYNTSQRHITKCCCTRCGYSCRKDLTSIVVNAQIRWGCPMPSNIKRCQQPRRLPHQPASLPKKKRGRERKKNQQQPCQYELFDPPDIFSLIGNIDKSMLLVIFPFSFLISFLYPCPNTCDNHSIIILNGDVNNNIDQPITLTTQIDVIRAKEREIVLSKLIKLVA